MSGPGALPSRALRLGGLALAILAAVFTLTVLVPSARQLTAGFGAYYAASRLLVSGQFDARVYDEPYMRPLIRQALHGHSDDIYNANPPTCALLFVPLAWLPVEAARWIWILLSAGFLVAGLALLARELAPEPHRTAVLLAALALGFLFRPVRAGFVIGQAYVFVFFLMALCTVAVARHRTLLGAGALGASLLLKSAGPFLPVVMLVGRRWRMALWTGAIALGAILLTLPLFPPATWKAYLALLREVASAPSLSITAYQTTRSLLWRLFVPDPQWNPAPLLAAAGVAKVLLPAVAAASAALTLRAARHDPVAGFVAGVAWGVLFSPLGEQYHHAPMLIPAVWLLARAAGSPRPTPLALGFTAVGLLLYVVPYPVARFTDAGGWSILAAYPRLYAGWALWLAVLLGYRAPWVRR
jgi:hypothetical protein